MIVLKVYACLAPFALLFVWSLCCAARRGDDMADAAWESHLRAQGRL